MHRSDEHPALQPAHRTARALKLRFWGCNWGCCTVRCVNEHSGAKPIKLRAYVHSASQLSREVSVETSFLCEKPAMIVDMIKGTSCIPASSWYVMTYQDPNLANSSSNLFCASLSYFIDSTLMGSLDTSVGTVTTLGLHSRQDQETSLLSKTPKPPLRPTRPPI